MENLINKFIFLTLVVFYDFESLNFNQSIIKYYRIYTLFVMRLIEIAQNLENFFRFGKAYHKKYEIGHFLIILEHLLKKKYYK